MGINSRHSTTSGRRPVARTEQPTAKQNKTKYKEESKKSPINWRFWIVVIILITTGYLFLKQIESYLIQEVYLVNKDLIPRATVPTYNDQETDDIIKEYQLKDKLPYEDNEIAVILLVLDSYKGKNMTKTNQVKSIVENKLTKMEKQIKKKYYIIELDNTIIMEDNKYKQEMPWNWLLDYKVRSVLDYGKLPETTKYIDVNKFTQKLRKKFVNSVISINIGTIITDSVFAFESLMDIGQLTKRDVIVTVSPGNYSETEGLTEGLKDFKYYTMQRIAFELLDQRVIDIKNFKIALNADKISAAIKDNPELYNEFIQNKIRSGMNQQSYEKQFIRKWITKYPEMFYSEETPMDYFKENQNLFDKDYEKEAKLANPKINLEKTKEELTKKIEEDRKKLYN